MNKQRGRLVVISVWLCYVSALIGPPGGRAAELDVNARDSEGRTALMFAAMVGQAEVVASLLEDGAEVNVADNDGWTPLMWAAKGGYRDIVEILLAQGAEIDATSGDDATALIMAAAQGRHDVVQVLVTAGADLTGEDVHGRTALDYARLAGERKMVGLLEEAAAATPRGQAETPALVAPLRVVGADGRRYATLGAALRDADPGGRIVVRPGVYREGLMIEKDVEIVGDGPREEIIIESADADCIMMHADRATVRGLTLRCIATEEDSFYAVDIPGGRLLLEDCDISSHSLACIGIHGDGARPIVRRCWIHDGNGAGVFVFDRGRGTIEECEIFGNARAGVAISTGGDPVVRKCRIHHGREAGVYVYRNGRGTLEDCDVYRNAEDEVAMASGGEVEIRQCRIARYEDTPAEMLPTDSVTTNLGEDDDRVDPRLRQIVLSFARPMDTNSWHLGTADDEWGQLPELVGELPAFFYDERTFVLNVDLRAGTRYAFVLNEEGRWAFRSAGGVPLEPTLVYFRTAGATQRPTQPEPLPAATNEAQRRALARIKQLEGKVETDDDRPGSPVVGIDLDLTAARDDDLAQLAAFPELQTLLLAGTNVTNDGMEHLAGLTELRTLDLTLTEVHDTGLMHLIPLGKLEQLYLARSVNTGFGLEIVSKFPKLRTLCLDCTAATVGPGLEPLRGMDQLETLSLEEVELDRGDLAPLEELPGLKILKLKKTKTTDADLAHIAGLQELLYLDLRETEITDAGLGNLAGLDQLKELHLGGTKVTEAGVRQLRRQLPDTEISLDAE